MLTVVVLYKRGPHKNLEMNLGMLEHPNRSLFAVETSGLTNSNSP